MTEPIRGKTEINDNSYRYKMEKLNLQKERTRTCITNLPKIALELKIPSHDLIVAFIKKKLSIAITEKDGKIYITNDIDKQLILNTLYEFIEYFVLCKKCHLPELEYSMLKNKVKTDCNSCGHSSTIDNNQHTDKVIKLLETKLIAMANANLKNKKKQKGALEIQTSGSNVNQIKKETNTVPTVSTTLVETQETQEKQDINKESSESFSSSG